jgi:hypothetical protein
LSAKGLIELAMDQASRMQRAREMGFDTDTVYYHGTRRQFDEFEPSQPRGAIGNKRGVYFTKDKRTAEEYAMDVDGATDEKSRVIEAYLRNPEKVGNNYSGDELLVQDPANIRSINAAFDPRYLNSSNLMGDGPSAAEPELDERLRNLLGNVKTIGAVAGRRGIEDISDCASVQILLQLDTDWWPEVTHESAKEKVANVWWSARNAAAKSERLAQNKESNTQSPQTHSGISNETKMYAPSPG